MGNRMNRSQRCAVILVLPVRGVEWTDLGDPRRALATLSRLRLGRERPGRALARLA